MVTFMSYLTFLFNLRIVTWYDLNSQFFYFYVLIGMGSLVNFYACSLRDPDTREGHHAINKGSPVDMITEFVSQNLEK